MEQNQKVKEMNKRKIIADWKKNYGEKFLKIIHFTEEKPKEWEDYKDKPKYYRSPHYNVGDEIYVYVTNDKINIPYSKKDLDKVKLEHLRVFCKGEVIGYYDVGYYLIITEIFIRSRRTVIGEIRSYHHGWIEDAEYLFKRLGTPDWRIA